MPRPDTSGAWRPQPQSSAGAHSKQLFTAIVLALAIGAASLYAFARATSRRPEKLNLGRRVFTLNAMSRKEAKSPLFFNDLVRDASPLPIIVSATGPKQWVVLNAVPPGSGVRCAVRWDGARRVFVDPCTTRRYARDGVSADGRSLTRYQATLSDKDRLEIDLNVELGNSCTITRPCRAALEPGRVAPSPSPSSAPR